MFFKCDNGVALGHLPWQTVPYLNDVRKERLMIMVRSDSDI